MNTIFVLDTGGAAVVEALRDQRGHRFALKTCQVCDQPPGTTLVGGAGNTRIRPGRAFLPKSS